jgi:5,10-methylenetetrahydromethanopterin reductase
MDFGTLIFTKPERAISDVKFAEEHGFTHAWIPDSHMIWGDTYACMALAAVNSKSIKLGTGVAIASNRIPPVTVHSIATINQIAPGRTILGFGTGHTGRRVMGLGPVKHADFREQVRVIHDLLHGGEAMYSTEGVTRRVRYLNHERRFINLDDRIPFYVAANGPKTLALAGEFGDGVITTGITDPSRLDTVRKHLEAGAAKAGRRLAKDFPIVSLTHVCVLEPGEKLDSPRVKMMTGHWVMASFHAMAAGYARPGYLPESVAPIYAEYEKYVAQLGKPDERYLDLHVGHCAFVAPAEWRFVTPETIAGTAILGTREEVVERLRALERAGLSQIFINPPMDAFNACIEEISRELITHI